MSLDWSKDGLRGCHALALAICGIALGGVALARADEFAYSGDKGPGFWGETPGWEACAATAPTQRQSPIDIAHVVADHHLHALEVELHETPLALINNGHTIEEEYEPGSSLLVDRVPYTLSQFHFHTLSEHTLRGRHGTRCSPTRIPTRRP
jgi:carbonic anhydrase